MNLFGRQKVETGTDRITKENVLDVLQSAMTVQLVREKEIKYLIDYERGDQPILNRVKEVRPEINNKIVENHANEIVTFYCGYVFGSPIAYIQRATVDANGNQTEDTDNKNISLLNEMFFEECKASKDQQMAKDFFTCGVGYRLIMPRKEKEGVSPFFLKQLPPDRAFIIYSTDFLKEEIAGVYYYKDENEVRHFTVYTEESVFYVDGDNLGYKLTNEKANNIGAIPIIEYKATSDRMGAFERVIPLLNAINLCTSDRMNGLAQFIQSILWINNVDLTDEQLGKLKDNAIMLTKNADGTDKAQVEYLNAPLNQQTEQVLKDDLYNNVLQISGVPSRESNTGGDTGQAVQLRNGFEIAESIAESIEPIFEECDRKLLRVALKIINTDDESADMSGLKLSDVGIQFNRNRTDGLLTKVQALNLLLNSGVHPLRAIDIVGLFSDAQQVYDDSKPYLDKYLYTEETDEVVIDESV